MILHLASCCAKDDGAKLIPLWRAQMDLRLTQRLQGGCISSLPEVSATVESASLTRIRRIISLRTGCKTKSLRPYGDHDHREERWTRVAVSFRQTRTSNVR